MFHDRVGIGAFTGMAVVAIASFAYQYMLWRVWISDSRRWGRDVMDRYEKLVRSKQAPKWPKILVWLCGPLGICIAFGSILFLG